MIEVRNVSKRFFVPTSGRGFLGSVRSLIRREGRTVEAVRGIDFSVRPGEFIGYIGPNGAGKSTTIKMLSGILHPSTGEIRIAGKSPQRERREVARRIGVVFGQRTQLWWDLPVADSYELLASMYGVRAADYRQRLDNLCSLLEVGEFLDVPVRKLSLGQRMRADLIGALLHQPPVLFLDEPTIGLDVVAKRRIRAFLKEVNQAGVTVLLTTHDLRDIEHLCERVIVINRGESIFDGDVASLKRELGGRTLLTAELEPTPEEVGRTELQGRLEEAGFTVVEWAENRLTVQFDRLRISAGEAVEHIGRLGAVRDLYLTEPDLEEAVEKLYLPDGRAARAG